MFPTKELIDYRKKEAARLQSELKLKLLKVQKLVINRILANEKIVFEISSYAQAAMIHSIDGINCGHEYNEVRLKHWDHMDFGYNNEICEFYTEQIRIVNYWIKILSDKRTLK
jgi:hypothetical protein